MSDLLDLVMRQAETELAAAHAEICKLQGLDPSQHSWPEWSSPANTLRWFKEIREGATRVEGGWQDSKGNFFLTREAAVSSSGASDP